MSLQCDVRNDAIDLAIAALQRARDAKLVTDMVDDIDTALLEIGVALYIGGVQPDTGDLLHVGTASIMRDLRLRAAQL